MSQSPSSTLHLDPRQTAPSQIAPRQRLTPADARRRTVRVKATRLALLVGAAASIAALAGTVGLRLLQPTTKFNQAVIQGESLVLDSPRFIGQTKSGDKVIVTAQKATRILSDDNAPVKLEQPVLETGD
ncbi:MAG: hypothetical protein RL186_1066, partial [Pseudomonadota bacterium]